MFTAYQYFVYFNTKTSHIEKVQKRATKFIISLKKYSYKDCLIQLNLPALKYRRSPWHMTEVFKIVKQKYDTTIVPEISVNSSCVTKGNDYKLLNQTFTTNQTLTNPPACMRDPACNQDPASISTSESDPRPVCGARRLFGVRLLSDDLRYVLSPFIILYWLSLGQ